MFGYLKPAGYGIGKHIKQYYRKQYCTLCHALWKYYGFSPRFLLSFDMAFIACLFDLEINKNKIISCYKKLEFDSEEWKKLAALSLFMVEGKLIDDIYDSHSKTSKLALLFFKKSFEKATADYKETHDAVMQRFCDFRTLEKQQADVTTLADAFAMIMCDSAKAMFTCSDIIEDIICHISRWVYFIDAVDDLDKDIRKRRFNPFAGKASSKKELITKCGTELMTFAKYTTKKLKTSSKNLDLTKLSNSLVLSILNITIPHISMRIFVSEKHSSKRRYVRLIEGRNVVYE
jgi:hypothetical protein